MINGMATYSCLGIPDHHAKFKTLWIFKLFSAITDISVRLFLACKSPIILYFHC